MKRIALLENAVREYAWGSREAIASLLGQPVPSPLPQAELWMGAHPLAPSTLVTDAGREPLPDAIRRDPAGVLGPDVARRFGGELPFLLKVLAAEAPLSLQAHPDARQAAEGFAREQARGVPLEGDERSYKDPRAKPELLCALGPFEALVGFRAIPQMLAGLAAIPLPSLARELAAFRGDASRAGLARFFGSLLVLPAERRARLVGEAAEGTRARAGDDAALAWVCALCERHPSDSGVLAPLLLNHVQLEPGEALFLGAGELHAYLRGVGVELMANSDNVLRGGLTGKHVDVPELLRALRFADGPAHVLRARRASAGEDVYDTPAAAFALSVVRARSDRPFEATARHGVEILLCAEGRCRLEQDDAGGLALARGGAALVPGGAGRYRVAGDATLYRATVPRD